MNCCLQNKAWQFHPCTHSNRGYLCTKPAEDQTSQNSSMNEEAAHKAIPLIEELLELGSYWERDMILGGLWVGGRKRGRRKKWGWVDMINILQICIQ